MRKLFALLIFVSLILPSFAQTKEEIQRRQQDLQKEIADLNATYEQIRKSKNQSLGQLTLIQRKIRAREDLVSTLNKDLRFIDENMYTTELEINRMKRELDTLKINYAQSLVFAYKNRSNYDYLNFIFSSANFNDALKRVAYLKSYRQYRETQASAIVQTQTLLKQKAEYLVESKKTKSDKLTEQSKELEVLEDDKKEKDRVVKNLKSRERDLAAEIKEKERVRIKLRTSLQAIIRREAEERRREAERLAQQQQRQQQTTPTASAPTTETKNKPSTNVGNERVATTSRGAGRTPTPFESTPEGLTQSLNFEGNRGSLPWPVDAGFVSIHQGTYTIPGTPLKGYSDGIEIAVNPGVTVKSVADGEVSSVFDLGGEQAIVIIHGKYFTTYGHLSSTSISKGQKVKAGTVLGRAATSDDGQGMVMFMVSNDKGTFLDPEVWLRRK